MIGDASVCANTIEKVNLQGRFHASHDLGRDDRSTRQGAIRRGQIAAREISVLEQRMRSVSRENAH